MDPDSFLYRSIELFSGVYFTTPSLGAIVSIVLAALLLYASGFVSASEIAFFSLSPTDLNEIEEGKSVVDKKISTLLSESERLLATILISNNFVNVTIIMLCNFFFASTIHFGNSILLEFILITVVLTFLLLLFGEIMPKIYSAQNTLRFCRTAAPVISALKVLFYPLVSLLVRSSYLVNKVVVKKNYNISVDELSHAFELTDKEELSEENNILEGIIRFGGETAKAVMTPRLDMVCLDITDSYSDVLRSVVENGYSRIPVYEEKHDNIKGILYIKDLLPYLQKEETFCWQDMIRPAYFVPETKMINDLLRDFQANKIHIAIVIDEFGGTSGLITMEDIIEQIVGEISDEYDEEEKLYVKLSDSVYSFEGRILLADFYRIIEADPADFQKVEGDADTLAGLLLELKGEFPILHESIVFGAYTFEVTEMTNRRILKVKVNFVPAV
ncbi:MAG: gliding motility-associated protein GldE [Phocaeicola sp.]